ncbi:MAG: PEP-CTERM sorting domain-containing protein [Nitrospirae bacterium]|nr:PEP-CTERM sorting domain-containing protein [Nitrospirota bacterium]
MKKRFRHAVFAAIISIVAFTGTADATVLYWADWNFGANPFPQAMNELGITYVNAVSNDDFNAKLGSTNWELAVLLLQGDFHGSAEFSNIPAYLGGGGRMIFTDWYKDTTMASWFGVNYTSDENMSAVAIADAYLQTGVGASIDLANPGNNWVTWSMGMSVTSASSAAFFPNGDTAIAVTPTGSIINGMMKDTFADYGKGLQLAKNELTYGQAAIPVPEPSTLVLSIIGLGGLVAFGRRYSISGSNVQQPLPNPPLAKGRAGWGYGFLI